MTEHSPLGGSGVERWSSCPGSVALLQRLTNLDFPVSDEPDYTKEGINTHAACARALNTGDDMWELVGQSFYGGILLDANAAKFGQIYVDHVRQYMHVPAKWWIEYPISSPKHRNFKGTLDFGCLSSESLLHVVDYKHGEGITVEVDDNPQLKYYAYGLIRLHPEVRRVILWIVQPRAYHVSGEVVRRWETTAEAICEWVDAKLLPAMLRTEVDGLLDAGPWCRFCPAKLVCPLLSSLFEAAALANHKELVNLNDESVGRSMQYAQAAKFYVKALEAEAFRRRMAGRSVPGTKLVEKKANRVYRDGADIIFKARFGDQVWEPREFKSPAQMAMLSEDAKKLVFEWAYTPKTGYTLALDSDPRPAVIVPPASDLYKTEETW